MENIINEDSFKWSPGDIRCLIDLYVQHSTMFDRQPKKKVWNEFASQLSTIRNKKVTGEQCDGKWKGLKSMYKKVKDHNNTSGNSNKKWEFFELMDEVLYKRPEITPPATCTSEDSTISINNSSNSSGVGGSNDYDFADCIIDESLTTPGPSALKKRKNEALKNKRHQEKMQRQDRFLQLFEKLVDKLQ